MYCESDAGLPVGGGSLAFCQVLHALLGASAEPAGVVGQVGVAVAHVGGPMHVLAPLAFLGRVGEAGAEGGEDRFEGAYPTWIS